MEAILYTNACYSHHNSRLCMHVKAKSSCILSVITIDVILSNTTYFTTVWCYGPHVKSLAGPGVLQELVSSHTITCPVQPSLIGNFITTQVCYLS